MRREELYGFVLISTEIESENFFRPKSAVVGGTGMDSFSVSSEG